MDSGSHPIACCPWCSAMAGKDIYMTPCFGSGKYGMVNKTWWCAPCGHFEPAIHTERFTLNWWQARGGKS